MKCLDVPTKSPLGETKVWHLQNAPAGAIYIGRPMPSKGLRGSKWANPVKIAQDTEEERARALVGFRAHAYTVGLIHRAAELKGHDLACWCAPKLCHGHVLAEMANLIHHHLGACPKCGVVVHASITYRLDKITMVEFWKCQSRPCGAYGWIDRGRTKFTMAQLFPLLSPDI